MNKTKATILSVCLRENVVICRTGPEKYMKGIVSLLRAHRTGTLLIYSWDGEYFMDKLVRSWRPVPSICVCLEDVRTFSARGFEKEHGAITYGMMTEENKLAWASLARSPQDVLEQAYMPRF